MEFSTLSRQIVGLRCKSVAGARVVNNVTTTTTTNDEEDRIDQQGVKVHDIARASVRFSAGRPKEQNSSRTEKR